MKEIMDTVYYITGQMTVGFVAGSLLARLILGVYYKAALWKTHRKMKKALKGWNVNDSLKAAAQRMREEEKKNDTGA